MFAELNRNYKQMNVFISYCVADTDLVDIVASHIKDRADVKYWKQSNEPGKEVWPTILGWIDAADLVLVLVTDKTMRRAFSVGQEVGHAKKGGKQIIPLVTKDVPTSELGFLAGITYISLDITNPATALKSVQEELQKLQNAAKAQLQIKQEKEQGIFILACFAVLLFLLSKE